MEGRRGPRARPGHNFREACGILMRPELSARRGVVADNRLLGAALLLRVKAIADHGKRGPARPDAMTPDFPRRMGLPVGGDAHAGPPAVAVRPAKAWPVPWLQHRRAGWHRGRVDAQLAGRQLRL